MKLIKCLLSGKDSGSIILNMSHIVAIEPWAEFTVLITCTNGAKYYIWSHIDTIFSLMQEDSNVISNAGIEFINVTADEYKAI